MVRENRADLQFAAEVSRGRVKELAMKEQHVPRAQPEVNSRGNYRRISLILVGEKGLVVELIGVELELVTARNDR